MPLLSFFNKENTNRSSIFLLVCNQYPKDRNNRIDSRKEFQAWRPNMLTEPNLVLTLGPNIHESGVGGGMLPVQFPQRRRQAVSPHPEISCPVPDCTFNTKQLYEAFVLHLLNTFLSVIDFRERFYQSRETITLQYTLCNIIVSNVNKFV